MRPVETGSGSEAVICSTVLPRIAWNHGRGPKDEGRRRTGRCTAKERPRGEAGRTEPRRGRPKGEDARTMARRGRTMPLEGVERVSKTGKFTIEYLGL